MQLDWLDEYFSVTSGPDRKLSNGGRLSRNDPCISVLRLSDRSGHGEATIDLIPNPTTVRDNHYNAFREHALLWFLFFIIALGLGYPTLNRYDPRRIGGTHDVIVYYDVVIGREPPHSFEDLGAYERLARVGNHYNRVLIPYVARPFYWLAQGRVLSWDPALLGLLVANGIFTATTAYLLVNVSYRLIGDYATALVAATLYLLNFVVANLNMAGLVDSGEGFFLMAIVWSLFSDRWFLLPILGLLGSVAKETFAPLSVVFAIGWWLAEAFKNGAEYGRLVWICALGLTGMMTVTIAMSTASGGLIWPWQYAAFMQSTSSANGGFLGALMKCFSDRNFWYVFIWLLPLGVMRLHRLPVTWVLASAVAFGLALGMGAYHDAGGTTARALFNVAGPILSLSSAVLLTKLSKWSIGQQNTAA